MSTTKISSMHTDLLQEQEFRGVCLSPVSMEVLKAGSGMWARRIWSVPVCGEINVAGLINGETSEGGLTYFAA